MKIYIENGKITLDFQGDTTRSKNRNLIEEVENDGSIELEIQNGKWISEEGVTSSGLTKYLIGGRGQGKSMWHIMMQNESLSVELQKLKSDYTDAIDEITELTKCNNQLEEQLKYKKNLLKEASKVGMKREEKVQQLLNKNGEIWDENKNLHKRNYELKSKYNQLDDEFESLMEAYQRESNKHDDLKQNNKHLEEEIKLMEDNIEQLTDKHRNKCEVVRELKKDNEVLHKHIKIINTENESLFDELCDLYKEIDKIQEDIELCNQFGYYELWKKEQQKYNNLVKAIRCVIGDDANA